MLSCKINKNNVPAHVAVIMDGNGRWAKKRGLPRIEGHKKGVEVLEKLVDTCIETGIKIVSIYAFSTENWSRPQDEVDGLWQLFEVFMESKSSMLSEKGVRIIHSGMTERIPERVRELLEESQKATMNNKVITLNMCINYGGRQELVDSVNSWLDKGNRNNRITADDIQQNLYTQDLPDVDLMLRTSGEVRISNFMLWQIAYAEMIFMKVLWPDFRAKHLYQAIKEYQKRNRRYGNVS